MKFTSDLKLTVLISLHFLFLSFISAAQTEVCTDPFSCNYFDPTGLVEGVDFVMSPETCLEPIPGCFECVGNDNDGQGQLILVDADDDGICDLFEIEGCNSPTACNFNPIATDNDGSCIEPIQNCLVCVPGGTLILDSDQDGVCNADEVVGCLIPTSCNYNPEATEQDNTLCIEVVPGCTECDGNGGSVLIDSDNDGICDALEVFGCTDPEACNFNSEATESNGACSYEDPGCSVCIQGQLGLIDSDLDGVCDIQDDCPYLPYISFGDSCDDNNPETINDAIDENCECIGEPEDICVDPFFAPELTSLNTEITETHITVSWEPVEGQVACLAQLGSQPDGVLRRAIVYGADVSSITRPISILQPGVQYGWRVCCACSLDPLIGSPFTPWQLFVIPEEDGAEYDGIVLLSGPNPVRSISNVTLANRTDKTEYVELTIVDLNGKVVKNVFSGLTESLIPLQFSNDLSDLAEGIYLYRAVGENSVTVNKFFVSRR